MDKRKSLLLPTVRQINVGAIVSGLGFLLYLGARALEWAAVADVFALLFALVSLYVLASVAAGRRRDKASVSYSLLWGQTALTLLLCMCALLTLREKIGA